MSTQVNNEMRSPWGPGPVSGYADWFQYMPYGPMRSNPSVASGWYDGYYGGGYMPPYSYDPFAERSSASFTDSYNRQYNERTNENIKVDKYIRYDDVGLVHVVEGRPYGARGPYFVSYDSSADPYVYRYPYAGLSTSDRGYFAQPFYSSLPVAPAPVVVPPVTRYGGQLQVISPGKDALLEGGPSQGYMNRITDRGPLYAPLQPRAKNTSVSLRQETGLILRNPSDRSVYDGSPERDSGYVYPYQETIGRK